MRHDETRDNTTAIENQSIEADAHDKIVAEARRESDERNGYDNEPEDDGQPSEYEEWQDYFGGDDYYDHSENEVW